MPYTTVQLVIDNHERIPATGEDTYIVNYITDADAIINGKLSGKFTLPFISTPALIGYISKSFATYFELRRLFGGQVQEMHSWIATYWDQPMQILTDIAECKINLTETELIDAGVAVHDRIVSNTKDRQAIFDLGDIYNQDYHPEENDERYGE